MLRKNPGLTAAVVATLMLGIGATTAIYIVVYAILIAPLPYPHADQLVIVWSKVGGHDNGTAAGDFLDWKQQSKSFQQLAAWNDDEFNLATQDHPEQVQGRLASPGWFDMQGIPFMMGRDFPARRRRSWQRPRGGSDQQAVEPSRRESQHHWPADPR
jgi:putative ABC transport system permease protein